MRTTLGRRAKPQSIRSQQIRPSAWWVFLLVLAIPCAHAAESRREWSGVYPHLAFFNSQGECGTGAVVPWADRLWVVTYSPHEPSGSDDKLYEIVRFRALSIS